MSKYFFNELSTKNYKGNEEDIDQLIIDFKKKVENNNICLKLLHHYDIIDNNPGAQEFLRLEDEFYKETGLCFNQVNIFNDNMELPVLNEDVLWRHLEDKEKVDTFLKYLSNINAADGDLTIIDPYLFKCSGSEKKINDYIKLLSDILIQANPKSICFITNKKEDHFIKSIYDKIKNNMTKKSIKVNLKHSSKFHDRFWLASNNNEKKGFLSGTSLNGIGNKISLISYLENEDVQEIYKLIPSK